MNSSEDFGEVSDKAAFGTAVRLLADEKTLRAIKSAAAEIVTGEIGICISNETNARETTFCFVIRPETEYRISHEVALIRALKKILGYDTIVLMKEGSLDPRRFAEHYSAPVFIAEKTEIFEQISTLLKETYQTHFQQENIVPPALAQFCQLLQESGQDERQALLGQLSHLCGNLGIECDFKMSGHKVALK